MTFEETCLNDNILDALYDMHFEEMTPIQEKCIPQILDGKDLLGVAQTGTGKTAAYLLPILSMLDDGGFPEDAINCVIMSPTRELAQQIDQAMEGFAYYLPEVSSIAVYGGNDGVRFDQEMKGLRGGAPVVIATPGRLLSHLKVGNLNLSRTSFFVLDEADRMLDMGFSEDIMAIDKLLPNDCQKIMFSATMPSKIRQLAVSLLKNPVEVKIAVSRPAEKIRQSAYVCYETQKLGIIQSLFQQGEMKRVIIFCGKKDRVKEISRELSRMKINCAAMHSDLSQAQRDEVMYEFKAGRVDVLVATDIVSRGIDIDDIRIVINYDVPHDNEDYVHRIGRTARADRDGVAITFVSDREQYRFHQIEEFLEKDIEKVSLPEGVGEAPDYKPEEQKKSGRFSSGRGGGRSSGRRDRGRGSKGRGGKGRGKKKSGGGSGAKTAVVALLMLLVSFMANAQLALPTDAPLTIRQELQSLGERLLTGKQGSIVAIRPSTGEILCMATNTVQGPDAALAIATAYAPGSTFKTAQALTLLSEGIVSPDTQVECEQGFLDGNIKVGCHKHFSPLPLKGALGHSCNTWFLVSFMSMINDRFVYETQDQAIDTWRDYMRSMGLGGPLVIDMPGEKGGLLANSSYLKRRYPEGWDAKTIIWAGMGQGDVTMTPLQMCNLAVTIANRGVYLVPHIHLNTEEHPLPQRFLTPRYTKVAPEAYTTVIDGMRLAVESGTAAAINTSAYKICGKTGTVENPGKDHSAFIGFAPMDVPEIAVAVYIEHGGFGADMAAPMASLIMEQYLTGTLSSGAEQRARRLESRRTLE